jgi:hypothetical protein
MAYRLRTAILILEFFLEQSYLGVLYVAILDESSKLKAESMIKSLKVVLKTGYPPARV